MTLSRVGRIEVNWVTVKIYGTFFTFDFLCSQASLMNARRVEVNGDVVTTVPNVEAILQDFRIIGEGLVKSLELRTEKWVV